MFKMLCYVVLSYPKYLIIRIRIVRTLQLSKNHSSSSIKAANISFENFWRILMLQEYIIKEQSTNKNLSDFNRFIIKSSGMSYSHFFDVPSHFVPVPNTVYRIVSVKDTNKAFTVTKGHHGQKLHVSDYTGDAAQKFTFGFQGNKVAFVAQATNTALYIPHHNKNDGAEIEADGKQHKSNWFQILPIHQGEAAGKGYGIKTLSGKALDLEGGNTHNGTRVLQWEFHGGANQVWLIVPADQPITFNYHGQNQWGNQSSNQGFGQHHGHKGHKGHGHGHGHGHHDNTNISNQGFNNQGSNQGIMNQGFINQAFSTHGFNNSGTNNQGFNQPVEMEGIFKKNHTYSILCSANQAKCLHVGQDEFVVVADFNGSPAQKYTFEYDTFFKHYFVKSAANGHYLGSPGVFDGETIKTRQKGIHCEKWTIEPSKKMGFGYTLRVFNGNAIDIPGNNYNNGTRVQKHGFHGDANQTFVIIEQ